MSETSPDIRHPGVFAEKTPDRPAIIFGASGKQLTFAEFEAVSNQFAHLLRSLGVARGDRVAVFLENHLMYLALGWGAFRTGARLVAIATHLSAEEVDYILSDSGARVIVTSRFMSVTASRAEMLRVPASNRFMLDGAAPGFVEIEPALARQSESPIVDQAEGVEMLYSSGT
ncbi:MAG: AMP-binding protein, partial [Alphaproteobacteria bacterium]|nr:AMP-binding protein [Alphaproteobacteria bacterium]